MNRPGNINYQRLPKRKLFQPVGTKKDQLQDQQIKKVQRKVNKIVNQMEVKHKDTRNLFSPSTIGTLVFCNTVPRGDDEDERTGDNISATSLSYRHIINTQGGNDDSITVRFILFWDSQANQLAPVISPAAANQMLDTTVVTDQILSPYNSDYQKRFKILVDRTITVTPTITGAAASRTLQGKVSLNRVVKYVNANAGSFTEVASNSLWWYIVSDNNVQPPAVTQSSRFRFRDN